jgi:putative spermidine/putrescine transport system permease protein
MKRKKTSVFFLWFVFLSGMLYFFLPLYATFDFSLRMLKNQLSFEAYKAVFHDPGFYSNFGYSMMWSLFTVSICLLLFTWTAYWMHLKLPNWRPFVEFMTLLPFVVPAVVLIFGLIKMYSQVNVGKFNLLGTPILLIGTYVVMSMPYMFRSVDAGLRAIDVRTLTEAGQCLGASRSRIMFEIIFPNLRVSLLNGIFLAFAIVIGEYTVASLLGWPSFGVYIRYAVAMKAYEPAALSLISFTLTWVIMMVVMYIGRGMPGQTQIGAH